MRVRTLMVLAACAAQSHSASSADLPEHTIRQTPSAIVVDGHLDEASWQGAIPVAHFVFPWYESGAKETTQARLLWDRTHLYVAFVAQDEHISAFHEERDESVSRDDCLEVFVAPDPGDVSKYFNFEFNALGTVLDRSPRDGRSKEWNAPGLQVAVKIDGTLNDDSDLDRQWVVELAIPFEVFADYAPRVPPIDGDEWRLNLYRAGGQVDAQYSAWSNTETSTPSFHVPERFGIVRFSEELVLSTAAPVISWAQVKEAQP
jgi:hypothetical protein